MRRLIIFIAILTVSHPVFCQIATPSLDPASIAEMPAAAIWRNNTTAALNINYGTGSRITESSTINDISVMGFGGTFGAIRDDWVIEFEYVPSYTTTIKTNGMQYDAVEDIMHLNVAFDLGKESSWGLKYKQYGHYNNVDGDKLYEAQETTMGAGLSFGFDQTFYLGVGYEMVNDNEINNLRKANSWANLLLSAAFYKGGGKGKSYRAEYSMITSDETVVASGSGKDGNVHPKTSDTRMAIEYQSDEWLFLGELQTIDETWSTSESGTKFRRIGVFYNNAPFGKKSKYVKTTLGVSLVPQKGMVMGLKYNDHKEEYDTENNTRTAKLTEFQFDIGYNF